MRPAPRRTRGRELSIGIAGDRAEHEPVGIAGVRDDHGDAVADGRVRRGIELIVERHDAGPLAAVEALGQDVGTQGGRAVHVVRAGRQGNLIDHGDPGAAAGARGADDVQRRIVRRIAEVEPGVDGASTHGVTEAVRVLRPGEVEVEHRGPARLRHRDQQERPRLPVARAVAGDVSRIADVVGALQDPTGARRDQVFRS